MTKLMQDILMLAAREVAKDLAKEVLRYGAVSAFKAVRARTTAARAAPEVRCVQRVDLEVDARERT